MKTKICPNKDCLKEKDVSCFSKSLREADGLNRLCRECNSKIGKAYYQKNKCVINKKHRDAYQANPNKILEHQREYYSNNKEKKRAYAIKNKERISENRRKNDRKKTATDPSYKLRKTISSTVRQMIKEQNGNKKSSILEFLPFTMEELIRYMEDNFSHGMTWENYGKYDPKTWNDDDYTTWTWQIDHIIPQSDLPYTSMSDRNFRIIWSLWNLRPFPSKYNMLDGVSRARHIPNRDVTNKYKYIQ